MRLHRGLIPCLLTLALTGCASAWVSHNERIAPRLAELRAGQSEQALKSWQAKADTDPVFALETGELARENRDFQASLEAWRPLDQAISAPPISAQQWADSFAAVLVNDRVRHYEPPPFEQVLLKTRIALNYLAQGDWDNARVAIRQAHELEARLKIEHEQRQQEIETRAKEKQAPGMKDLGGYPVEVINAPEVLALKNGYQSAISHYLAGFVYEALGETSLAAAGYRQAIELQPDQPELDAALAGLDSRRQQRHRRIDTLFLIEAGWAPARIPQAVQFPVFYTRNGLLLSRWISVSFPTLQSQPVAEPLGWQLDDSPLRVGLATDTALLARRALHDEMPATLLRTAIRVGSRQVAMNVLERSSNGRDNLAGNLASLFIYVTSLVTEQADDRCWRT